MHLGGRLLWNAELWASGGALPPVVGQASEYQKLIKRYQRDITDSYKTVAKNLVDIAKMAGREDKLGKLIKDVAKGAEFLVDTPAKVGVMLLDSRKMREKVIAIS